MRLKTDKDGFFTKSCKKCRRKFKTLNQSRELCTKCFCKKFDVDPSEISVVLGGTMPKC